MSNLRVYIAGPMTGLFQHNYPAFDNMESWLSAQGYDVRNPAMLGRIHGYDEPYQFYIRESIDLLLTCNAIVMLPGWQQSRGAKLEYHIAATLGFTEIQIPGQQSTNHGSEAATTTEGNSHDLSTRFNLNPPDFIDKLIAKRYTDRFDR